MKRCIIFSRVSSLHQSTEEQTNELRNEAYRNGYTDSEIFPIVDTESAIKLSESERKTIQKLYKALDEYPIECVICRELSRIARRPDVLYSVRDELIKRQVQLIVCQPYMKLLDDKGKLSQTANIMFSLFSSIAESEMAIKIERFKEGKLRKKNEGKWAGGWLPFGYRFDKDTHIIYVDEKEGEVVRSIFDMYVNKNMSTVKIARHFNVVGGLNCCESGKEISCAVSTIGSILKNRAYIGEHPIYRGKIVDNVYPRIVPDELFNAVKSKLSKHNSRKNKNVEIATKHIYFCQNLICDVNGNKLTGLSVSNSYRFVHNDVDGRKYRISVPINMVDSLVWHYTMEYMQMFNPVSNTDIYKNANKELHDSLNSVKTLRKEIDNLNDKIDRANHQFINNRLSEEKADAIIDDCNKEIDRLEEDVITKIFESETIRQRLISIKNGIVNPTRISSDQTKFDLIHQFVKTVEVEPISWGEYNLTIIFINDYVSWVKFKSMSKTAYDPITNHIIQFDYLNRFERPFKEKKSNHDNESND